MLLLLLSCAKSPALPDPGPGNSQPVCKPVAERSVCFPAGHVCTDPHGIGDGVPIEVDCWSSGGQLCHPASETWPSCAGGWVQQE